MAAVMLTALSLACLLYGWALHRGRRSLLIRQWGAGRSQRLTPSQAKLAEQLHALPATRHMTPQAFRSLQWWLAAAGLCATLLPPWVTGQPLPWLRLLLYPTLLWLLPPAWLGLQMARRRGRMTRCYPDLLAHLATQTEAGASTLQAFQTAPPVVREPLRLEVEALLADLRVAPLPAALRRFAARTGSSEIQSFAENVIYQQSRGIALRDVLADEEAHFLALARQQQRRRIQASSVTMAVVTVLLLLNGLIIYFTPVAYDLLDLLSRAG